MEKETKKLLLVAVSVGVFLLVTITVSLVILTPSAQIQESAFTSSVPYPNIREISEITNNLPLQTGITDLPVITFPDERQEAVIADRNEGDRLVIQIPTPSSTAIPEVTAATTPSVRQQGTPTAATQTATAPAAATPSATASAATTRTVQPATTTRAPSTATRPATTTRTINDYWIQTGAFSAIVRAEDARNTLATKGLVSIIETREVNNQLWYRVRLGPYTTEREANHWLAIVREIDGFRESQVRQTVRQQ